MLGWADSELLLCCADFMLELALVLMLVLELSEAALRGRGAVVVAGIWYG